MFARQCLDAGVGALTPVAPEYSVLSGLARLSSSVAGTTISASTLDVGSSGSPLRSANSPTSSRPHVVGPATALLHWALGRQSASVG